MRTSSIRIILQLSIVINNMIPHDKIFLSSFHTDSSAPPKAQALGPVCPAPRAACGRKLLGERGRGLFGKSLLRRG